MDKEGLLRAKLTQESVVRVKGRVRMRPEQDRNPRMSTGEVEVLASEVEILNQASPNLPFTPTLKNSNVTEELRQKFRYIDLRRESMQHNIRTRAQVAKMTRDYLDANGFVEIETPLLFKSTPEGAREFIVPSRRAPDEFYALPQSPQQYKQLLMAAGFERYYQLAKCFRDEDLRADRQPEFTQVDMELSFTTPAEIQNIIEGLMVKIWKGVLNVDLKAPFPRLKYEDAMRRFGSDKPDTRFGLEIETVSSERTDGPVTEFFYAKHAVGLGSATLKHLEKYAKTLGDDSTRPRILKANSLSKLPQEVCNRIINQVGHVSEDDVIVLAHRGRKLTGGSTPMGKFRTRLFETMVQKNLLSAPLSNDYQFLWVHEFPLFTKNDEGLLESTHHPFTAPMEKDLHLLQSQPEQVRAQHYDLVLNGVEIGGGSIRIHHPEMQRYILADIMKLGSEETRRFQHLIEALSMGCPPHGGLALGFDRLISILCGVSSIRDVIAFPKSNTGSDLVVGSPSRISDSVLSTYHFKRGDIE